MLLFHGCRYSDDIYVPQIPCRPHKTSSCAVPNSKPGVASPSSSSLPLRPVSTLFPPLLSCRLIVKRCGKIQDFRLLFSNPNQIQLKIALLFCWITFVVIIFSDSGFLLKLSPVLEAYRFFCSQELKEVSSRSVFCDDRSLWNVFTYRISFWDT